MVEKRECKRKALSGEVAGKIILVDHLKILDLSMKGIRFRCSRRVEMNSIRRIKIERGGVSLDIRGEVVRSSLCIEQQDGAPVVRYEVAMRFKNISKETEKSLEQLISLIGNG
jgi:hypothetical protein